VATIAQRGTPFIDSLKAGRGVRLIEVGQASRERLAAELVEVVRGLTSGNA
jgi:hypothetical protein